LYFLRYADTHSGNWERGTLSSRQARSAPGICTFVIPTGAKRQRDRQVMSLVHQGTLKLIGFLTEWTKSHYRLPVRCVELPTHRRHSRWFDSLDLSQQLIERLERLAVQLGASRSIHPTRYALERQCDLTLQ